MTSPGSETTAAEGQGKRETASRGRRVLSAPIRIALAAVRIALVVLIVSMITDRMLPDLGIELERPTRFGLAPNVKAMKKALEYEYVVETNGFGLRARELMVPKPPGVRRLVVLGDAQTFGVGVDARQTFCAELERRVAGTEVADCAVPGANLLAQARTFYHAALRYEPDAVLLCVSADSLAHMPTWEVKEVFAATAPRRGTAEALWPNTAGAFEAAAQRRAYGRAPEREDFVGRISGIARRKQIPDSDIEEWKHAAGAFAELVRAADEGKLDGNVLAFGLLWPRYWTDALDLGQGHGDKAWEQTEKVLGAIARESARRGARFAVAFIPAGVQYDRARQAFFRRVGYHVSPLWLTERSRFEVALGRWCGDRAIPFIDLTDSFRSHSGARVAYAQSGHLTAEGHRLVAERLEAFVSGLLH